MKKTITIECKGCKEYKEFEVIDNTPLVCDSCSKKLGEIKQAADVFDYCPVCSARQFYTTKDFNQFIGCTVLLAGIILVPFTYGLSLPVFALIDWLLYKRFPTIIVCYRCAAEFRGFAEQAKQYKPFMHHIGLKYDKYR